MRVTFNRRPPPTRQDWHAPSVEPPPQPYVFPPDPPALINVREAVIGILGDRHETGRCSRDTWRRAPSISAEAEDELGETVPDTALGWEKITGWLGEHL